MLAVSQFGLEGLLGTPPVFFQALTLPGEYRDAGSCNCRSSVILG
jgi:hypothetical protein